MRVFQKRMLSGSPSRSNGPGRSSRKKLASDASNDRSPLGTMRVGPVGVASVTRAASSAVYGVTGVIGVVLAGDETAVGRVPGVGACCVNSQRISSAKSRATVKRSLARRANAFMQTRSRSGEMVSSNKRGERTSSVATNIIRSSGLSERKGRRPVSNSYSTTPRL